MIVGVSVAGDDGPQRAVLFDVKAPTCDRALLAN